MTDLIATIGAIWDGKTATQKAQNDIKGVESSTSDLALQQQLAADKSAKFAKRTKELSIAIAKGEKTFDSAEKELSNYRKELGMGEKATEKSIGGMGKLAAGLGVAGVAFVGLREGAEVAYRILNEGADLQFTASQFDNLSVSIGTNADVLRNDLTKATSGMVSQNTLMADSLTLMEGKLATSHEEVVRMASISGQLNWNMDTLGRTINNLSTERLDDLGLAVSDVKPRFEELKKSGMDANEAFKLALLEAGEKKILIAGSAADSTTGDMLRLEASLTDISDSAKLLAVDLAKVPLSNLAVEAQGLSKVVSNLIFISDKLNKTQGESQRGVKELKTGMAGYLAVLNPLTLSLIITKKAYDEMAEGIQWVADELSGAGHEVKQFEKSSKDMDQQLQNINNTFISSVGSSQDYFDSLHEGAEAEKALAEQALAASIILQAHVKDFDNIISATQGLSDSISSVWGQEALDTTAEAQGEWVDITVDNTNAILGVIETLNSDLDKAQLAHYQDVLKNETEGGAAWLDAYAKIQGDLSESQRQELVVRKAELEAGSGEIRTIYTGDAEVMEEMAERQKAANQAIIDSYNDVALAIVESGLQEAILEGGADAEASALGYIAMQEALGMITEEEATALQQIALETLAIEEATDQLTKKYLADGELTRQEAGLIAAQIDLIAESVQEIPPEWDINIEANTSAAERAIDSLAQKLETLAQGANSAEAQASTAAGNYNAGHAAGGTIRESGVYTVGETGAERVYLPQGAQVQNSQQYNQQQYTINTNDVNGYMAQIDRQARRL